MTKIGKIYTIASGKGGVGKTTLTINLAAAIAEFGKEVIILDADLKMANIEILLGMTSKPITLQDVLSGNAEITDAIYDYPKIPGLKVITAGLFIEGLGNVDMKLLPEVIRTIKGMADFVIIDSPPGLEAGFTFSLQATDEVILVTMPTMESLTDTIKIKIVADRLGIPVTGTVLNMIHRDRLELSKDEIQSVLETPIIAEIPFDTEIKRAAAVQEPIIIRNPKSAAGEAIKKLAADLIGVKYDLEKPKSFFSKFSFFKK